MNCCRPGYVIGSFKLLKYRKRLPLKLLEERDGRIFAVSSGCRWVEAVDAETSKLLTLSSAYTRKLGRMTIVEYCVMLSDKILAHVRSRGMIGRTYLLAVDL